MRCYFLHDKVIFFINFQKRRGLLLEAEELSVVFSCDVFVNECV